eukprot:CAMPEP_0177647522 /NCGR_PEP_ID=MMETSP0447-20121125/10341_1 /TAXON_ID=0 /ORGANISM="Stygamoeba regulata, Strain BSH-02190019" /LENGTH=276 /DNA_ID=CAMNT_0019150105 /DNA_START=86 /DNA_END=916 /DNA_ORIENTATION=-
MTSSPKDQAQERVFCSLQLLVVACLIGLLLPLAEGSPQSQDYQLVINVDTTDQALHVPREFMYMYRNNTAYGAPAPLLWEIVDLSVESAMQVFRVPNQYHFTFTYRTVEGVLIETTPVPTASEANWLVTIDDFADPTTWQYIVDTRYPTVPNTITVRIDGTDVPTVSVPQRFELYLLWGQRPVAMRDLADGWKAPQEFTMSPALTLLPGWECFLLPGTPLPGGSYPCSHTNAPAYPLEMLPNKTAFDPPPTNQLYQLFVHRTATNKLTVTSKDTYF